MAAKSCIVSFIDLDGIHHAATVEASSLYEAAVLAAAVFHQHGCPLPPAIPLQIEITGPSVVHRLTMVKVQQWLATSAKSPKDMATKERLKGLLPK